MKTNRRGRGHLVGDSISYVDLSMFQLIGGLCYAFPRNMARHSRRYPRLIELCHMVEARPNIDAYLRSERRLQFNEDGIFRHYAELDG